MELLYKIDPAVLPNVTAARDEHNAKADAKFATDEAFVLHHLDELLRGWIGKYKRLPPPPPPAPAIPPEVSLAQGHNELIAQGLHNAFDPLLSEVQKCIDLTVDLTHRQMLHTWFQKSNVFQRDKPELVKLWTDPKPGGLGKTLAELDATFVNASKR